MTRRSVWVVEVKHGEVWNLWGAFLTEEGAQRSGRSFNFEAGRERRVVEYTPSGEEESDG